VRRSYATGVRDLAVDSISHGDLRNDFDTSRSPQRERAQQVSHCGPCIHAPTGFLCCNVKPSKHACTLA
jgi:hypothetical protein